jgi:amidohydrolase
MTDLFEEAQKFKDYAVRLRRDFHQNPELGFNETRTAAIIARELNEDGFEVTTGVGETGVVGLLEGAQEGPVVLLRFDMDALPIQEETGKDYQSIKPGVMHACGHDGHVAVGLSVAKLLSTHLDQIGGTVKFVFQPAEEGLGGAKAMIEDGVLDTPKPDYALAMHLWNSQPVGWLGIMPSAVMAGSGIFKITLRGKGGHGAIPEEAIDPVVAAAHIATALQTIISRNVSPMETAVISVTQITAGDTFNIIPETAVMLGTYRYFSAQVHQIIIERIQQMVSKMADAFNCDCELQLDPVTSPVVNDEQVTQAVLEAARETFEDVKINTQYRSMVSEDMAEILDRIPGCYFYVGSANLERELSYPHHHPRFDFDEAALPYGVALMAGAALKLLKV